LRVTKRCRWVKGGSGGGEEHQQGDEEDSAIFILRLSHFKDLRWVLLFILPSSVGTYASLSSLSIDFLIATRIIYTKIDKLSNTYKKNYIYIYSNLTILFSHFIIY